MLLLLTLAATSLIVSINCQSNLLKLPPRFKFDRSESRTLGQDNFYIDAESHWQVGSPDRLAVRTVGSHVDISLKVDHCDIQTWPILKHQCSRNSEPQLVSLRHTRHSLCESTIPFTIDKLENRHNQTLVKDRYYLLYQLTIQGVKATGKHDQLRLSFEVECKRTKLKSHSLNLFVIDQLAMANSWRQLKMRDKVFNDAGIVTVKALRLLESSKCCCSDFNSIDFIQPSLLAAIRNSLEVIKPHLAAGFIVTHQGHSCSDLSNGTNVLRIMNHLINDGTQLQQQQQQLHKATYLDLDTGQLHYATYPLIVALRNFYRTAPNSSNRTADQLDKVQLCNFFTFNDNSLTLQHKAAPSVAYSYDFNKISSTPPSKQNCQKPTNSEIKNVSIISGGPPTFITCPIQCTDTDDDYLWFIDAIPLNVEPMEGDWKLLKTGIELHITRKTIRFPSIVNTTHQGAYACSIGGIHYLFQVQVTVLPHFQFLHPRHMFAMAGENVTIYCKVAYYGLRSVKINARFFKASSRYYNWIEFDKFNQFFNSKRKTWTQQQHFTESGKEIRITSMPASSNFNHSFYCSAVVQDLDFSILNYTIDSPNTTLQILRKPTPADFHIQQKLVYKRHHDTNITNHYYTFVVSLMQQFTDRLLSLGVKVTGHFKIASRADSNNFTTIDKSVTVVNQHFDGQSHSLVLEIDEKWCNSSNWAAARAVFDFQHLEPTDTFYSTERDTGFQKSLSKLDMAVICDRNRFSDGSYPSLFPYNQSVTTPNSTTNERDSYKRSILITMLVTAVIISVIAVYFVFIIFGLVCSHREEAIPRNDEQRLILVHESDSSLSRQKPRRSHENFPTKFVEFKSSGRQSVRRSDSQGSQPYAGLGSNEGQLYAGLGSNEGQSHAGLGSNEGQSHAGLGSNEGQLHAGLGSNEGQPYAGLGSNEGQPYAGLGSNEGQSHADLGSNEGQLHASLGSNEGQYADRTEGLPHSPQRKIRRNAEGAEKMQQVDEEGVRSQTGLFKDTNQVESLTQVKSSQESGRQG